MASFPTLLHLYDSERNSSDGHLTDEADDGTIKTRVMYANPVYTFSLHLGYLTSSQVSQLMDHYSTHKTVFFTYTWPGDSSTYSVMYTSRPQIRETPDAYAHFIAEITLSGTAVV